MSVKKLAVLSMLVVMLIAFNIPASAQVIGGAGISATATSSISASGFGAFGGFGFPFNWGFSPLGVGCFPFNWCLGGGWGPFSLLRWCKFSPCFFGATGNFPFSPGFLGCCQPLPFILGSQLGCRPVLGWDVSPWAFGLQSCVRSLPLYFGAHGFGFPFSLGNYRIGLIPSCGCPGPIPVPVPVPAAIPVGVNAPIAVNSPLAANAPVAANMPAMGIQKAIGGLAKISTDQPLSFILGSQLGCRPCLGWDVSPWAFGLQSCVRSLPLYFGAHGFGFPFSLGNYRIGLIPSCCC
jgi:hypothetical protein